MLAEINNDKSSSHEGFIYGKCQYHKYKFWGGGSRWSGDSKCLKNVTFQVASPE